MGLLRHPFVHIRALIALVAVALTIGGTAAAQPEIHVSSTLEWHPTPLVDGTPRKLEFGPKPPIGLETPHTIKNALYASVAFGPAMKLVVALDTTPDEERIWVDTDLDLDLTDEARVGWEDRSPWLRREEIVLQEGVNERRVPVRVFSRDEAASDRARFGLTISGHFRGTATLGGRERVIALVDGNSDLQIGDPEQDLLVIDVDGDGHPNAAVGSLERFPLGLPFRFGDEAWTAHVTPPPNRRVEFLATRAPGETLVRRWEPHRAPPSGELPRAGERDFQTLQVAVMDGWRRGTPDHLRAVEELGALGTDEAFAFLVSLMKLDPTGPMGRTAVRAMGNPDFKEAHVADLAELTRDPNPGLATAAIQALHRMGWEGRGRHYESLLEGRHELVQATAAAHLVYLRRMEVLDRARERLASFGSTGAQGIVYQALRTLPAGPGTAAMLAAARADDPVLAVAGLRDLAATGHPLARDLIVELVDRWPTDPHLGELTLSVLGPYSDRQAVDTLFDLISGGNARAPDARLALRGIRSPEGIKALTRILRREKPAHRALGAEILGEVRGPGVAPALLLALQAESDPSVERALIVALGAHRYPEAIPTLRGYMANKDARLRGAALAALARFGSALPDAQEVLGRLLDVSGWEDLAEMLLAAGQSREPMLAPKLLEHLDHRRWQVRLAAAEALRLVRRRESVLPLIQAIDREKYERVREVLGEALHAHTGIRLYGDAELWASWWADHGATFEFPEEPPSLAHTDATTRAEFFGIPLHSNRVVFVVDRSGSMAAEDGPATGTISGTRLEVACHELRRTVAAMADDARVNVIFFDHGVDEWRTKLTKLNRGTRSALDRHLDAQEPDGGTNIYDSLVQALEDEEADTIVLLSDGEPSAGVFTDAQRIRSGIEKLNGPRRIVIHCVAVGMNSYLMRGLAADNGGTYIRR